MEHVCEAMIMGFLMCGRPEVELYRCGCEHEHLRDVWLCPGHGHSPETGECRSCGHRCKIMVVRLQHDDAP